MVPNRSHVFLLPFLSFFFASLAAKGQSVAPSSLKLAVRNVSGEPLPGAAVTAPYAHVAALSGEDGVCELPLMNDTATVHISCVGYETLDTLLHIPAIRTLHLTLKVSRDRRLDEVVVTEGAAIQETSQMSRISVPLAQIQSMPRFFGETDIMKTLQTLPGVQQGNEGSSALLVRGGTPDQNLILIDGFQIYNPSHLIGIFSSVNPNFIQSVDIYKGAFPAHFGGRLSSVVDLKSRNGDMNSLHGNVSLGVLMSQLTLEGPLWKGKTSFIISGRRTYHDLYAAPVIRAVQSDVKRLSFYFYDLNAKVHHRFSEKSYLDLAVTNGGDRFKLKVETDNDAPGSEEVLTMQTAIQWNNTVGNLKYHYQFSPELYAEVAAGITQYKFTSDIDQREQVNGLQRSQYKLGLQSSILDYTVKTDIDYRPGKKHALKLGASGTYHTYNPTSHFEKQQNDTAMLFDNRVQTKVFAMEWDAYAEDDWDISDRLKANVGLHANALRVNGHYYTSLQPRISARYLLPGDVALKASYVRMNQNIHLLSSNSLSLPTDLWIPATSGLRPEVAQQVSMGVARNIFHDKIEFSVEGYYKAMDNVVEYKEGASYLNALNDGTWEDKVTTGKGYSYGAELFLQKKTGRFTGWLSYTLAWSNRKFEDINYGRMFPYKYDRRHTLNLVGIYKLKPGIELSGSFVFQSAAPYTIPTMEYEGTFGPGFNGTIGQTIQYYPERNNIRIQATHRMDVGISFIKQKKNGRVRTWNFSVYNVYNRRNLFYYDVDSYTQNSVVINGYSMLPILPSISYNLKF